MKSWIDELSLPRTLQLLAELAWYHLQLSGPHQARLTPLLTSGKWGDLLAYEPLVYDDGDVNHLMHCRQALGFFQKLEPLDIGVDKEEVAYNKFLRAEEKCAESNAVFRAIRLGLATPVRPVFQDITDPTRITKWVDASSDVNWMRRKISAILGEAPSMRELHMTFGPGATTTIKRRNANPQAKFASGFACSTNLYASGRVAELLREFPHWLDAIDGTEYCSVDGWECKEVDVGLHPGQLQFVPKNAKSYRSIIVEPGLNTLIQSGIQRWMRTLLKRTGVDIRDQSLNQRLAQRASLTGELATLDLSSASDLMSTGLIKLLLPDDWYALLNAARTSEVEYRGVIAGLHKFCSMGNGFTFPLETMIFFVFTLCASRWTASSTYLTNAYGDDIVCAASAASDVIRWLEWGGFEVNQEKSFTSGPFFESCGRDYYLGIDIRPFYQKTLVSVRTLYSLHNFYWRRYGPGNEFSGTVRRLIPRHLRLYGPDGYGDGVLISDRWASTIHPVERKRGYAGVRFDAFAMEGRKTISVYPGDWVSPLYTVYADDGSSVVDSATWDALAECNLEVDPYSQELRERVGVRVRKDGRPEWTLPGTTSYKRVSIYTLEPSY